jgi:hypothetical protein
MFTPRRIFIGLFFVLAALYISCIFLPRKNNHLIGSDGVFYYIYLRSLVMDHDVQVDNDVALFNSRMRDDNPLRVSANYQFSIGPTLLWGPFFVLGHSVVTALHGLGVRCATDGFSRTEEALVCLASIFYTVLGLFLLYRSLLVFFPGTAGLTAVLGIFWATGLVYYTLIEPFMAHALEFFTVSLFIWSALTLTSRRGWWWAAIGVAGGLMAVVRWQNTIFLLLLPVLAQYAPDRPAQGKREHMVHDLMALCGFVPIVFIQMMFWKMSLGSWLIVPQGPGFLTPTEPKFLQVLFSLRHGFFVWHPIILAGFCGLLLCGKQRWAWALVLAFVLETYICAITRDWWCGHAFGLRRLLGTLPFIAFGLTAGLAWAHARWPRLLLVLIAALVVWNGLSIVQYKMKLIPADGRPTIGQMTWERLLVPLYIIKQEFPRRYPDSE